ncbi:hypothetical protein Y032_0133g1752 [Ancylostoma ceylanicum]|uniref:Uncharacterized protein n=1 Tax=Ancylostoma ceylanicum TaxID=53326 RepID=A0A016T625_9BILA|nr:hypothetical protein Y032_0133g1752 [Ancylostoma ceylanicum]
MRLGEDPGILSTGASTTSYGGIVNEMFEPSTVISTQPTTSNGNPMPNGEKQKGFDDKPLIFAAHCGAQPNCTFS